MSVSLVPGSPEWGRTITGSKVPAIFNKSPYDSPTSIWHQLAGLVDGSKPPNDAMMHGTRMEPVIVAHAWEDTFPAWEKQADETTWTRDDLPFPAACNTDSHGLDEDGQLVVIEAKDVGYQSPLDQWGEPGTFEVPDGYLLQAHYQLLMTGARRVIIHRHGPANREFKSWVIDRDEVVLRTMKSRLTDFYTSVAMGKPPKVDGHPATFTTYKRAVVEVDDSEWEVAPELVAALDAARADEDDAASRRREATSRILQAMGTAKYATVDGERMYRRQKSGKGVALYPVKRADAGELAA